MEAYKFKIRTSETIKRKFERTAGLCCAPYNGGLQERRNAYRLAGKTVKYVEQANQLPEIKRLRLEFNEVHSQVLQHALKWLDTAFQLLSSGESRRETGLPTLALASSL